MKKFSLKSFQISNTYYQPIRENLTDMSKNDTILFYVLKGMKLVEEKKHTFPEKIEITLPQALISLHLSDSINNHIHQYAFDRRMDSNTLINYR